MTSDVQAPLSVPGSAPLALGEREELAGYRALIDAMDEAFALIELVRDADGRPVDARCLRANRAFERVGQCPREVLLDRPLSEVAPELHAWWVALHAGVVASGHGKQFVHSLQDVGQTWDVRLAPFGGDRVAVRLDDVTARLRAERLLLESGVREAFLVALDETLRPLREADEIHAAACRLLGEHLAVDRCYFTELDWANERSLVRPDFARAGQPSLAGVHSFDGSSETLDALRRGDPFFVDDVATAVDISPRTRARCAELGIGAYGAMPLSRGPEVVWSLNVASAVPRAWSVAEIALVGEAGERTWVAIERGRAEVGMGSAEARRGDDPAAIARALREALGPVEAIARALSRAAESGAPTAEANAALTARLAEVAALVARLSDRPPVG